jgi:uncharacterized protein
MLYDNALLVALLCDAVATQPTQSANQENNRFYIEKINEILQYIQREMTAPDGGFYAAQDADTDGVEGKFYTFTLDEWRAVLSQVGVGEEQATALTDYFNITKEGNWEETNILTITPPKWGESIETSTVFDEKTKNALYQARVKRASHIPFFPQHTINRSLEQSATSVCWGEQGGLDSKHLLGWNALMAKAYVKAYYVTQNKAYLNTACRNIGFLWTHFNRNHITKNTLFHTYKDGKAQIAAFLDDYAYWIDVLIDLHLLQQSMPDLPLPLSLDQHLQAVTEQVFEHFFDAEGAMFYFASQEQTDLLVRKKDWYDGAQPSGNATMCNNLLKLALIFDRSDWHDTAVLMLQQILPAAEQYPQSFARWAQAAMRCHTPYIEVAIVGAHAPQFAAAIQQKNMPNLLLVFSEKSAAYFSQKHPSRYPPPQNHDTHIYICTQGACLPPVNNLQDFYKLVKN